MQRIDKIKGSLLGAAIGDAMGAATEVRTAAMIREKFGGKVTEFLTPPDDTFARGSRAGQVTDDFSMIYCILCEALAAGGITEQVALNALLRWAKDERNLSNFAGPTTRAAILSLMGEPVYSDTAFLVCDNSKASNGAAMKTSPAGLLYPGDLDRAIEKAIVICRPTHNNDLAMAGACAVAAAVSQAAGDHADLFGVVQAGLYGARQGLVRCDGAAKLAGPSVEKRMQLAVQIGLNAPDMDTAMEQISDVIGTGLHIAEAVPAAFGLLVAAKADPMEAIIAAVNIGNDTDTIASIVGAIAGTLGGAQAFDSKLTNLLESENGYDFDSLSNQIEQLLTVGGIV